MLVLCVRINEHMLIRGVGFSFCMTDGTMLTDIAFQKKKKNASWLRSASRGKPWDQQLHLGKILLSKTCMRIAKAFQVTLPSLPRMLYCLRGAGFSLWAANKCVYFCDRKFNNYWTFCHQSKHNYFIISSLLLCQLICRAVIGIIPHYYVPRYSCSTCSVAVAICRLSHTSVVSIGILFAAKHSL